MKKSKGLVVLAICGTLVLPAIAGCGGGAPEGFTEISYYASQVTAESRSAYTEMVKTYNETQGKTDKIYVTMQPFTGDVSDNLIIGKAGKAANVVSVANMQFKGLATRGNNFVSLEQYLDDEAKTVLDWEQIPNSSISIWRFNTEKTNGKYLAGEGADLLGMPFGNDPQVLFYNTALFKEMGINIISVNEDLCGKGEYNKLMPHGYAEYAESYGAPISGMTVSQNSAGQNVYKVFNNRVPMSWEEQRILARDYQTYKNNADGVYGYMSEWWFNYGWSVGGDCIGWNATENTYKMTFDDKSKNYLALETIEVNGATYHQGDVLDYEDKVWLNANWDVSAREGKVTEIPSMYEAFLEFNRLGIPKSASAETGVLGYGVAPATTTQRQSRFTSGMSPMLNEYYSNVNNFSKSVIKGKFDIAPLCQYRKFEGGSTYQKNGDSGFANEYLKVIGLVNEGDENTYTGALETVRSASGNEVPVMGEAITCANKTVSALAIPKNSDPQKYSAAFKFIAWACGPQGQSIISKGNTVVPNQNDIGLSDAFSDDNVRVCKNAYAAALGNANSFVGDWSYFNAGTWIVGWSTPLNSNVREGKMTLQKFFDDYSSAANTALLPMTIHIKRP